MVGVMQAGIRSFSSLCGRADLITIRSRVLGRSPWIPIFGGTAAASNAQLINSDHAFGSDAATESRCRVSYLTARSRSTPPMTKDRLVASYMARLNEEGTEFRGGWTLTGGVLNAHGRFTATKR